MKPFRFLLISLALIVAACTTSTASTPPNTSTTTVLATVAISQSLPNKTLDGGLNLTGQTFAGTGEMSLLVIRTDSQGNPEEGWGIHVSDGVWSGTVSSIFNPLASFPVSITMDFNYAGKEAPSLPICIRRSRLVMNSFVISGTESLPDSGTTSAKLESIVYNDVWETLDWILATNLPGGAALPRTPVPRCDLYTPL